MKWITLLLLVCSIQSNAQQNIYRWRTEHICFKTIPSNKDWEVLNNASKYLVVLDVPNKKLNIYANGDIVIYITSTETSENQVVYKGVDQDNTKTEARFIIKDGNVNLFLTYPTIMFHHHLIPEN